MPRLMELKTSNKAINNEQKRFLPFTLTSVKRRVPGDGGLQETGAELCPAGFCPFVFLSVYARSY